MTVTWTAESLAERLALGEDSRVEFKEVFFRGDKVATPRRKMIADELAAFGNTLGGTLILSVSDAGEVQPLDRQKLDFLENFIFEICEDRIDPPLAFTTQRVALPQGPVLVVEVGRSDPVHLSPGGYLHRQGSSKRHLSSEALHRLFQQRSRSGLAGPDETIVAGTGAGTFDPDLRDRLLSSRTDEPPRNQLIKLGMLREDRSGALRATVAGVLLGADRPDNYIRGARIEAVRYLGSVLGEARQHDAKTLRGPLDKQIREAVQFVRLNSAVSARRSPGLIEIPQFNDRAVFEAIVNAVVHRDYTIENARIRLFIFDDRLELYSPGSLPNSLTVEAMRARQSTRNETLASLMGRLPIGDIPGSGDRRFFLQERGEGVPIIYRQTRGLTGRDPVYELLNGYELRLTIPAAPPPVEGISGEVTVLAAGKPLVGARVVAHYPNLTWMAADTDTFGRATFDFHSELPITVFCAALGYTARVEQAWRPPEPLSLELEELRGGGSAVFTEGTGHLPGLAGRLNPILDNLDRTYLYTTNIAIEEGKAQPVHFKLGRPLLLTDVNGFEWSVRFVDMIGKSSLVEYRPPRR